MLLQHKEMTWREFLRRQGSAMNVSLTRQYGIPRRQDGSACNGGRAMRTIVVVFRPGLQPGRLWVTGNSDGL